ncbi:MAG: hypothetical protein ACTSUX_03895 [Promethearchaeota archaeon]
MKSRYIIRNTVDLILCDAEHLPLRTEIADLVIFLEPYTIYQIKSRL